MPNGKDLRAPAPPPPVIVVSGFMGTGKTTVGRVLADMLALDFVDTDTEIENSTGLSVSTIFETHGEAYFRKLEESVCLSLVDRKGLVIATGGGALLNESVFDALSRIGRLVLLETSIDVLCRRASEKSTRPLLNREEGSHACPTRIVSLLEQRSPVYDRIDLRVNTSRLEPVAAATEIVTALDLPCHSTEVCFVRGPDHNDVQWGRVGKAHIDIGRGVLSRLGERLKTLGLDSTAFLLVPEKVKTIYLPQLSASLDRASIRFATILVDDGDSSKHLQQVERIIDRLVEEGARRDSTIITAGGGVTGDIGGFVASVFMRGVPLVHVPTTLLAQVDSSIGGKAGVNHALAKNLIGCFYQPHIILIDPCTLRTLPTEEISNGMAEVVKSAIIGSASFFEFLEKQTSDDPAVRLRDIGFLETCIVESTRIKTRIVNQDPFEEDLRRSLNLGHTVGHAIEASTSYNRIPHGQAVSLGIITALKISVNRGYIGKDLLERVSTLLEWCGLPTRPDRLNLKGIRERIRLDKKIKRGKIHYVLPMRLGRVMVADDITEEEIVSMSEGGAT